MNYEFLLGRNFDASDSAARPFFAGFIAWIDGDVCKS